MVTLSLQLGNEHVPVPVALETVEKHTPLAQSLLLTQFLPVSQPVQVPPQSVSVSAPFFLVSLQVGAAHVPQATPPAQV